MHHYHRIRPILFPISFLLLTGLAFAQADSSSPTVSDQEQTQSGECSSSLEALTERQSIDAYNSLEDGQPGGPGEWEMDFNMGWETASGEHDPVLIEPEIKYTPDGSDFLRNMQLFLKTPVELGNGGIDGNGDLTFGWQQRWVVEDGWMPTLSTLAEVRAPSGYQSSGVDGKLTGIVAKDLGPGTFFLNGFMKTANGDNIEDVRRFQWGFRAGYKYQVNDSLALIGDYVHRSSEETGHANSNILELSAQYAVNDHLTIGPGISIGLDDNEETPNFGAGGALVYGF